MDDDDDGGVLTGAGDLIVARFVSTYCICKYLYILVSLQMVELNHPIISRHATHCGK